MLFFLVCVLEVNFLENEEKMENKENWPEAKKTAQGKWKCPKDNMEYDSKEDYEEHCKEDHMEKTKKKVVNKKSVGFLPLFSV